MRKSSQPAALDLPIGNRFGYVLRRASVAMMAHLGAALAKLNLRPVEATILIQVKANPGCSQSDIGRTLGIQRANMAPLTAGLSKRGLLEKSPINGRSQGLSLSEKGQILCARAEIVVDEHEAHFAKLLAGFDEQTLREALGRIASGGQG